MTAAKRPRTEEEAVQPREGYDWELRYGTTYLERRVVPRSVKLSAVYHVTTNEDGEMKIMCDRICTSQKNTKELSSPYMMSWNCWNTPKNTIAIEEHAEQIHRKAKILLNAGRR